MSLSVRRLLIVEDDEAHADAIRTALEGDGHQVEVAFTVDSALDRIRARNFDLVLTDLQLGEERDGLDLLREIRRIEPELSVFLITGHGNLEVAVRSLREGAADYLTKPVNIIELRSRVQKELEKVRLSEDNRELRAELDRRFGLQGMVGHSPQIEKVFNQVRQAGTTDASVLILGESGTGKELVARALHQLSPRSRKRFVAVNCAALTESLMESELFGHAKGSFTGAEQSRAGKFEYANGGTLFLDEIGDMALDTQGKLLRALENRTVTPVGSNSEIPVDVRILAATNRDLAKRVQKGEFREDLFYRLNVIPIELPPLRKRQEDIPLLVEFFKEEHQEQHGRKIASISDEVYSAFAAYPWPGNVRELRNAMETMVVMDHDGVLGADDLPPFLAESAANEVANPAQPPSVASLAGRTLEEVEMELIAQTLELVGGNRSKAARSLGMGERTLYRKIKDFGLGTAK
ncbi:MAG TPA: sigma-54 dependent transcriptional regulator [Planctomycetota bacterium]|nr:sigma-54 dependent transcriptional regulator [Planctomycetota bacterium]|tara:strand:- start:30048 stop:31439 length:1392 start_codon:yes stop_codon:yes gene_type:complete